MATYSFTKAVNVERLTKEIRDSAIKVALDYVSATGTAVDCVFKDSLDTTDEALLNTIITATENTPLPESGQPKDSEGRPEVVTRNPLGTTQSFPSHNFCDPTTWFMGSTEVTGETATLARPGFYVLAHKKVIDVTHGKIAFETPTLNSYKAVVYDNGVELVEGQDYTINYDMGVLVLDGSYTANGAITVDYHYASSSTYRVTPDQAKGKLHLKRAEVQFSGDIRMKPIEQNILAGGFKVESLLFKNLDNFVDVGRQGTGTIEPVDTIKTGRWVFPFIYEPAIVLDPAFGMQLEFVLPAHEAMGGERGTVTIYGEYLD
jgi:hypothetical protein